MTVKETSCSWFS